MVNGAIISVLGVALLVGVDAQAFFVCPAPCEAMFLPRDMESKEDCMCLDGDKLSSLLLQNNEGSTTYRCPTNSSAKALHPKSFSDCACSDGMFRDDKSGLCLSELKCQGKYMLKSGFKTARSLADCECVEPYTKDESTGECFLDHCPRAANYLKKSSVEKVHSLVDCDCLAPYAKNAQSGECFLRFECPAHSSPPLQGYAKSIADCKCDWGFVRPQVKSSPTRFNSESYCVAEKPSFVCPPHSRPVVTLKGAPTNFLDCECANGFERKEKLELCSEFTSPSLRGGTTVLEVDDFQCPAFSMPLAPHPYSMSQCKCLPGFEPNLSVRSCDWTPNYYVCPSHSYNPYPALPAIDFMDCHCAKGYLRNDSKGICVEKPTINENGCPAGALIENWPVHDPNWDCFCPHGDIQEEVGIEAIASPEFMVKLSGENFEPDWGLQCLPTPPGSFFGCPPNAVMNNWPVMKLEDCSCKAGFDTVAAQNELGMACNRTMASLNFPPCGLNMSRSPSDNVCRYAAEEVLPTTSHVMGKIVVNGNELDYVLVEEDIMVTQGDIAVGTSFGYLGETQDDLFYILHGYYNKEKESRWKDAKICFTIDPQVSNRRDDIWNAMNHITLNTGFTFLECKEEYCGDHLDDCDDLVDFSPTASSCWSSVGRVGGRQMLGVSSDCSPGNLIHVILHAVGLHHSTVRPDRDSHIQIAWECVESTKRTYFVREHLDEIYSQEELNKAMLEVPYDFFSIMHHRADAFTNVSMQGGCMSVIPLIQDPYERQAVMTGMGQREQMTLTDIHYVWILYPELKEKRDVIAASAALENLSNGNTTEVADNKDYHESRLHTKADAINYHSSTTTFNTIGAVVCVVTFLAIVGFGLAEMKRLAKKKAEAEEGRYSDPLLTDPIYD
ncbi:Aste57867_15926 [Aphanomyces stellatus]|uniref:Aste57867_15926 protein n=1 Tax=Aphanomyces stellatus TaxID=120398 RepID=A0A485L483_9STRA|nr:hypothetical protein As57867_015870 [Aphanomyces stellatus]VFT92712.1 Aste57867_15926 [Aphanomyces stellatus]